MTTKVFTNVRSFPTGGTAFSRGQRVILSSGNLALAGATDLEIGVIENPATTNDTLAPVRLVSRETTLRMLAGAAISQYADVYPAASGKISSTSSGGPPIGIALEAASGNGSLIEVLPYSRLGGGYKLARGQATTVTASDTILTGLATVVAVVAGFDDNPGDDPEFVSASIGDQAGSPAAGSFYLKTWKNTGGTDPTPVAASTFSKKVNWIAIGT